MRTRSKSVPGEGRTVQRPWSKEGEQERRGMPDTVWVQALSRGAGGSTAKLS